MDASRMSLPTDDQLTFKVKRFLKGWEAHYVSIHHKEPEKHDIPDDIRVVYKIYKKIRDKQELNQIAREKIENMLQDLTELYLYEKKDEKSESMMKNEKIDSKASSPSTVSTVKYMPADKKRPSIGKVVTRTTSNPEIQDKIEEQKPLEPASEELLNEAVDGILVQLQLPSKSTTLPKVQVEEIIEISNGPTFKETVELNLESPIMSRRIPKNTILQCEVHRGRKILPFYTITNQYDNRDICIVKKIVKGYKIFTIKNGEEVLEYIIEINKDTYVTKSVQGHTILITTLESSVPRNVQLTIYEPNTQIKYNNRQPKWNPSTETYTMSFEGRVTEPSVKNFIFHDDNDTNVLLFGKTGRNDFVMDCRYPFQPDHAISAMISVFDAVDNQ